MTSARGGVAAEDGTGRGACPAAVSVVRSCRARSDVPTLETPEPPALRSGHAGAAGTEVRAHVAPPGGDPPQWAVWAKSDEFWDALI